MDTRTKKTVRSVLFAASLLGFLLAVVLAQVGGGSAATDGLARYSLLLLLLLGVELSFDIARRVQAIWEDDQLQPAYSDKWLKQEAASVNRKVFVFMALCMAAGFGLAVLAWHINLPRLLTELLHPGQDTRILVSADDDITITALIIGFVAAAASSHTRGSPTSEWPSAVFRRLVRASMPGTKSSRSATIVG